ncbi:hypothetical protein NBO_460gi001 [Nosema bombycis CQ1]|uniref:Uncharacterized protein n=1 Tax=Nosema bombycis (strain CQ1 / CVCC 102059) TaxID=578461 RepID=R0KNT6_NOSB1|nr:hypothetical protein NBO_460gi001 [Nosema bombycis CQ1]|eukprot:EOB12346.1 hypothetical protein NBO_460gi001 [Nosema bombycis CQ1]
MDIFIIRKKTNIRFSEHFFMDYDEDFIIEKLTTLKYTSEFFSFKNVSITINENENSSKSNCFLLDDFYSEIYKNKLKKFYDELITIKKESNWSLLSLKDILDVDYKKQKEKADAFFIREEYSDALKIYSKFKTEDDFSHYNMEMEVYCRYLLGSNPYSNLIHLTNTNFVNSFYHHRLVMISLLIGKNDFCYRISRLLNEPYKMFIDLELSNRFLKGTRFYRKGLDLLFFCILYYRNLNFPCDKLIDQFISSVDQNEKILEEPLKCLKNLKSSPESCGIDVKPGIGCFYKGLFLFNINDQRYFIMIKYKDDEHNIYITFDKTLNVCTQDKIFIYYISKFRNSLKYTINDQLPIEIETKDTELGEFYNKHVIFESDIDFARENDTIFTLKDFINQTDKSKNSLSWCKEVGFCSEGSVVLDGLEQCFPRGALGPQVGHFVILGGHFEFFFS